MIKTMPAGRPRIIRGVMRPSLNKKTGRYKRATDRRTHVMVESVRARDPRFCASPQCIYSTGLIEASTTYVKVTDHEQGGRIIRGRVITTPRGYHPDCVPARAFDLVRFIIPMEWVAYSCTEWKDRARKRLFTSPEAWLLFTDKHYPSMRRDWSRLVAQPVVHQPAAVPGRDQLQLVATLQEGVMDHG